LTHTITIAAAANSTATHDRMTPTCRFVRLTNHDATHTSTANITKIILMSVLIVLRYSPTAKIMKRAVIAK
jgi:hypothetical protein